MDPLESSLAYVPNARDLAIVRCLPLDLVPTISVVIPSFNQAVFLRQTLDSVFAQDYPKLEVFVADGGSSDGSVEILKEYRSKHPDVFRFVSEVDGGQANGLNRAIDATSGELVAWINSDDVYLPGTFWKVFSFFHFNRCALVVYGRNWYTDEKLVRKFEYPVRWSANQREQRRRMMHFCLVPQPSLFFRRVCALSFGGPHPSNALDYDLWLRWQKYVPFYFIDDVLSYSRLHADCKTVALGRSLYEEIFRILHYHYGTIPFNFTEMLSQHEAYGNGWTTGQVMPITPSIRRRAAAYWIYYNVRWFPRAIVRAISEIRKHVWDSIHGRF